MTDAQQREAKRSEPQEGCREGTASDVPLTSAKDVPSYEPPAVITYRREELLEELGPAQACSFSGSVVGC